MATFVLVHGPWHGGWCWERVAPLLRAGGHRVETPDLPGHGDDRTLAAEITLRLYTEAMLRFVAGAGEPVVLVGHGTAGAVISQVAEHCPDGVAVLVYLAAFLLRNGESALDVGLTDRDSLLAANLLSYPTQSIIAVRPESLRDVFYHDCTDPTVAGAIARVCPEPIAPAATPISVIPERFGRVRRIYVETRRDHALGTAMQRRMYGTLPCERVLSLDTGHAPFFSAPEELASRLLSV
ncbi:MAG TPA: alpha/beta fold hydrolase [Thermomicrobiales bacterium]|jgi:pimeloyl-ACP methyl ester carboxylesterase